MRQTQSDFEARGCGIEDPALDRVEERALSSWHEAAGRSAPSGFDWRLDRIGDALCSVSASETSILLNRVLSLGAQREPSTAQLRAIRAVYAAAGVSRFFVHLNPQRRTRDVVARLAEARFRRHRGWMKFIRGREPVAPVTSDLSVRRIDESEAPAFAAIAGPAFDLLATSRNVVAALADSPGWHLYMSFDGKRPAGTGAIFVDGDIGYLDWAATHPDFRRRGSQTALLNARLRHALDAGCSRVAVMTGEAVPGDPQHSYRNILRAGFSECFCRDNWIPED